MPSLLDTASAIRAGIGLVDVTRPGDVGALELGFEPDDRERWVYRVLGVRQVVQALVVDRTGWARAGALVDALHGASMVALAARVPRYRRGALVQAGIATAFAVTGLAAARSARRTA